MNVRRRELGVGMCITGVVLWLIALVVDAPTVAVVLSILILMGGGLLLASGEASE